MVELPPKCYLDYFAQMLGFVEQQYGFALGPAEWEWLADFRALSEDARSLHVRNFASHCYSLYFLPFQYHQFNFSFSGSGSVA
jgi:hypothetical protein